LELKERVRVLAEKEFRPKTLEWDEKGEFAWENLHKLTAAGLSGLTIPKEYGGQGRSFLDLVVVLEELARNCHITAMILQMNLNGPPLFIRLYGTEAQKKRYLPEAVSGNIMYGTCYTEPHAGSALTDLETAAVVRNGQVIINGHKHMTTHGHVAKLYMVLARFGKTNSAKGLGLILVPRDAPGFRIVGVQQTMRGGNEAELEFKDCVVPAENVLVKGDPTSTEGFKKAIAGYNAQRVGNAAISVGLAQGAFELSVKYAKERRQFGRPIAEFQGIQWMLAEMATKIEAARCLVYRAAALAGDGLPPAYEASMAKLFANSMMLEEVVSRAVQIHGWKGYVKGYPVEWMYRAARGQSIAGGTVEMVKNYLGSAILGQKFSQRSPRNDKERVR